MTAIELLVEALRKAGVEVSEVLGPDQCALIFVAGHMLHVTAEFHEIEASRTAN